MGSNVTVWRHIGGGEGGDRLGCSTPCVMCRPVLVSFDMTVHCNTDSRGGQYHGKLDDAGAPPSVLTSKQKMRWNKEYV